MISPHKIKYREIASNELNMLDLIVSVAFDSDNGETSTYLNRESVVSETYDGRYKRVHTYKYGESFSPKFTFTKSNFEDFTIGETRQVLKWLTGSSAPSLLDVYYDDSEVVSWSAIGGWTEISTHKLANNRTVAITATFEAVTPYAMSELKTSEPITIQNATNNIITIELETDEPQYPVYPRIKIKQNGIVVRVSGALTDQSDMIADTAYFDGANYYWRSSQQTKKNSTTKPSFDWPLVEVNHAYTDSDIWKDNTIYHHNATNTYYWAERYVFNKSTKNPNLSTTSVKLINKHADYYNTDNKSLLTTSIANNTSDEEIILDGANRVVSSSNESRIFGDDFINWNWLPLYDGVNPITVEGNCTVTIEYRHPIKCGEF